MGKDYHANSRDKKAREFVTVPDKTDFKEILAEVRETFHNNKRVNLLETQS